MFLPAPAISQIARERARAEYGVRPGHAQVSVPLAGHGAMVARYRRRPAVEGSVRRGRRRGGGNGPRSTRPEGVGTGISAVRQARIAGRGLPAVCFLLRREPFHAACSPPRGVREQEAPRSLPPAVAAELAARRNLARSHAATGPVRKQPNRNRIASCAGDAGRVLARPAHVFGQEEAQIASLLPRSRIRDQIGLASSSGIDFWHFE